jgi:hypothetical protein
MGFFSTFKGLQNGQLRSVTMAKCHRKINALTDCGLFAETRPRKTLGLTHCDPNHRRDGAGALCRLSIAGEAGCQIESRPSCR